MSSGPPQEGQRYAMLIQYGVDTGGAYGAGVNVYLTRAPDTLYITDTMPNAPTSVYADGNQSNTKPDDQIIVGYNPLDTYHISDTTPRTSFLDGLLGPLSVIGSGDTALKVFDETAPASPVRSKSCWRPVQKKKPASREKTSKKCGPAMCRSCRRDSISN